MSLISVSDIVSGFNNQPLILKRFGTTSYIKGRPVQEEQPLEEFFGNVQNATGRALQVLPEGLKTKAVISVFTVEKLRGVNETDSAIADQVMYLGSWYRVFHVFPWGQNGYNEAVAVEVIDNGG